VILGHGALAVLARDLNTGAPWWLLFAASFGPDLLDKPLAIAFDLTDRGVGHSFLSLAGVALLLLLVWRFGLLPGRQAALALALWVLHLITDFPTAMTFWWPLYGMPSGEYLLDREFAHWTAFYLSPKLTPVFVLDACLCALALTRLGVLLVARQRRKASNTLYL